MAEFKPASPTSPIFKGIQTDVFTYTSSGGQQSFAPSKVPKTILNFYSINLTNSQIVGLPSNICLGTDITATIEASSAAMFAAIVSGNIDIKAVGFGSVNYTVKVTYLF